MGTWGVGPWENDDALDWLEEVGEADVETRSALVLRALEQVSPPEARTDPAAQSETIAAAALVGASLSPSAARDTAYRPQWLDQSPLAFDEELVEKSRRALMRVTTDRDTEWWQLWEEAGLADQVHAEVKRLLAWLGDRAD